ncbi:MAG: hypothetical protein GC201_14115 [Alphaproteobacteria bacterium]|nr:hypothetical protein [Alphaproteobacteria bacterium]
MKRAISAFACLLGAATLAAGPAEAACKIKDLSCWGKDSKCNIKFINNTGKEGGSSKGTEYDQETSATTIRVKTRDEDGKAVGNRTLDIPAGQSMTDNLDKKDGFQDIQVIPTSWPINAKDYAFVLSCDQIRTILSEGKNCKVFVSDKSAEKTYRGSKLSYNCGGAVVGTSADYHDSN